jgi:ribosomal protein L7/L12
MAKNLVEAQPMASHNNQKMRTHKEEFDAYRRRIRRWHKKAVVGLSLEEVKEILTETLAYSKEDTKDEPANGR